MNDQENQLIREATGQTPGFEEQEAGRDKR